MIADSAPAAISAELRTSLAAAGGVLFDLDGTLALGDRETEGYKPLPGALELIAALQRSGRPFVIFTNGTLHTPRTYVEMLGHAGFTIDASLMFTPAVVAAQYFVRKGYKRVLVLGVHGVSQPLVDAGIAVVRPEDAAGEPAEAVFVGWHPEFGLRDIEAACRCLWAGGELYTASNAPVFATRGGKALGISGAICAAIKSVTKSRVTVLGKPSLYALRAAAHQIGVPVKSMVVVGDDPILETAMARAGGAYAIGVTTGLADVAGYAALPTERSAHLVVTGVAELVELLGE